MDFIRHRSWMYNRINPGRRGLTDEFISGVNDFVEYACSLPKYRNEGVIRCPCRKCKSGKTFGPEDVVVHLYRNGFKPKYWWWIDHGEVEPPNFDSIYDTYMHEQRNVGRTDNAESSRHNDMIRDAANFQFMGSGEREFVQNTEQPPNEEAQKFYDLLEAVSRPLWEGSTHSQLSTAVRIMSIKSDWNVAQDCMNAVIELMREVNPQEEIDIPKSYYHTKKLVSKLGISAKKIDCCPSGCMLYYNNDDQLEECKFCENPRYRDESTSEGKRVALKSMHYLPLIPRLKRLYASMSSAPHMRWHYMNRRADGVSCHPSDGLAWRHFDEKYPDFAADPRNIRLGLCADGFTPFSMSSTPYSCWPVFVTPYNLPPEMCMTTSYIFLSCVIPGPHNPKNSIDVYLQPLIDELKILWHVGVLTYDILTKENFYMRAALMWTINDFPAYGMLSGWSTAGRLACPICMEDTKAFYLKEGRKNSWFDCHRRWLGPDHTFRRNVSGFMKKRVEHDDPPRRLSGEETWDRVCHIPKVYEVRNFRLEGYGIQHNWTKQSIFWELPYWKDNLLRHNLDVMHIEKNFFDNLFNTVMDVKDKSKDNVKARLDLMKHCRRSELHLQKKSNGKYSKPKAKYTFTLDERRNICEWIKDLKMPDGYSSNMRRCVQLKEGKLTGLKSHDCHVLMENLLPVAFNSLPENIWKAITEISQFFKQLCSSTLRDEDLDRMQDNIPVILCKLEKIFPPGFFDVMEHLPIHLVEEARLGGPVQYRWMYPFERNIGNCKRSVKQKARVEGSICEAYLARETSHFCSFYFENHIPSLRNRVNRHDDGGPSTKPPSLSVFDLTGRASGKATIRWLDDNELNAAKQCVLLNCEEIQPTLRDFRNYYGNEAVREYFSTWFRDYVQNVANGVNNPYLHALSWGPSRRVKSYHKYFVNGYKFHTATWSEKRKTVNSGVWVRGDGSEAGEVDYYGVLEDIVELEYSSGDIIKSVILFYCKWFDPRRPSGTKVHPQYNLVEVRHTRQYGTFDPFVIAQNARQVYYVPYPLRIDKCEWWAVIKTKPVGRVEVEDSIDIAFQNDTSTVEYIVDNDLEDNLRDFHCNNEEEVDVEMNKHDAYEDAEEEHLSNDSDEEIEFLESEGTSPEEEFEDIYSD